MNQPWLETMIVSAEEVAIMTQTTTSHLNFVKRFADIWNKDRGDRLWLIFYSTRTDRME